MPRTELHPRPRRETAKPPADPERRRRSSEAWTPTGDERPGGDLDEATAARLSALAREIASAVLDVPVAEIARRNRSVAETCQARHLAIYLAHVAFQVPLSGIAVHFGRDRTSVAHAVRRIEDGRDDPSFERLVGRLERLARAYLDVAGRDRTDP